MAIFDNEYRVGLSDVGHSNEITNKAILRILENVAGMHSESVGWGLNSIERTNKSWILLGWKVQIISRPIYNEKLIVKTWGRDFNRAVTYRDFEVFDEKENLVIKATSKWTMIDIRTSKLVELTPEITRPYECEKNKIFEQGFDFKIKEPMEKKSFINYKVMRRDIDINKHVHNLYYLDFAYEALPENVYNTNKFNNVEIMYKRQIKLDDNIICYYTQNENENIVTIKSEDDKTLHAIIKLY